MITNLKIKNFTAFDECDLNFSPKINIIIGENSSGKTHLLKLAYFAVFMNYLFCNEKHNSNSELTNKLIRLFLPEDNKLGKLHRTGKKQNTSLDFFFSSDNSCNVTFNSRKKMLDIKKNIKSKLFSGKPTFIPTKEVLTFIKGYSSHSEIIESLINEILDDTYADIVKSLRLDADFQIEEKYKWIYQNIVNLLNGKFDFSTEDIKFFPGEFIPYVENSTSDNKYNLRHFKPKSKDSISANMTAEGYRKLGMLQQLIFNGTIAPGINGSLFWDEPEANMNPNLMKLIVNILLELSRKGQQIILATHDYILLKWFDLLADKGKEDHITYHVINVNENKLNLKSTDSYLDIKPNSISETFNKLTDYEISNVMGELGK